MKEACIEHFPSNASVSVISKNELISCARQWTGFTRNRLKNRCDTTRKRKSQRFMSFLNKNFKKPKDECLFPSHMDGGLENWVNFPHHPLEYWVIYGKTLPSIKIIIEKLLLFWLLEFGQRKVFPFYVCFVLFVVAWRKVYVFRSIKSLISISHWVSTLYFWGCFFLLFYKYCNMCEVLSDIKNAICESVFEWNFVGILLEHWMRSSTNQCDSWFQ